jgi:hypothetical protein
VVVVVVVVVVPEELELLDESSFFAQEMMMRLKRDMRIMDKTLFIFSSIPKVKYYCLCIRRTQYIPRFGGVLQVCVDFTWRVSDCEEIEGVTHKREWGREIIESK